MTDAEKRAAYRAFSAGYITESEARDVLGDDWERVEQLLTIEQHVAAVDRDAEDTTGMTNDNGQTPDYRLWHDDLWVAEHVASGIASHGSTPSEAVAMADEAAELHQQDHDPGDDEFQREMLDRFDIEFDDGEDTDLWQGIQDAKDDKFVRPDQEFKF